jgi:hypothetical protein
MGRKGLLAEKILFFGDMGHNESVHEVVFIGCALFGDFPVRFEFCFVVFLVVCGCGSGFLGLVGLPRVRSSLMGRNALFILRPPQFGY